MVMAPNLPKLLTIDDLAELAGKSRDTIRRHISQGKVRIVRPGGWSIRIHPDDAARYLKGQPPRDEP